MTAVRKHTGWLRSYVSGTANDPVPVLPKAEEQEVTLIAVAKSQKQSVPVYLGNLIRRHIDVARESLGVRA